MASESPTELAAVVGRLLKAKGEKLVTAESCTGGGVAEAVTAISGSSEWFDRGFITYSNEAKQEMLKVSLATLERHGAVSEPTAREMALGALAASPGTVSVSVTGIAGPSGGSASKPVGTVCFAWARSAETMPRSETRRFSGDREDVRRQSVNPRFARRDRIAGRPFVTTLYLVRHGQASFAAANYDCLSELGHRQSAWLGEHFAARGIVFSRAVCGSLDRQRQTARTLLDAMGSGLPVIEHPGWNEYSGDALYKAYHGEGWAKARAKGDVREFYRTIKAALLDWSEEKLAGPLPETWREFGERTAAAMHAACEGMPADAVVLASSSGGAISRAVCAILQAPAQTAIELNLQYRNSAFCEIFVSPRSMRLVSFNCIPHLDRPDRQDAITYS